MEKPGSKGPKSTPRGGPTARKTRSVTTAKGGRFRTGTAYTTGGGAVSKSTAFVRGGQGKTSPGPKKDYRITTEAEGDALARKVGDSVKDLIAGKVRSAPGRTLRAPDPQRMAETIVDLLVEVEPDEARNEMVDLVAPLWSAEKARSELGVTRPSMKDRRATGALLGLSATDSTEFAYPTFQFERHEGKVRVKPALRTFMMALRHRDPWSVAIIAKTPVPDLDGLTPVDWVRQGHDPKALVAYASRINAEFER